MLINHQDTETVTHLKFALDSGEIIIKVDVLCDVLTEGDCEITAAGLTLEDLNFRHAGSVRVITSWAILCGNSQA